MEKSSTGKRYYLRSVSLALIVTIAGLFSTFSAKAQITSTVKRVLLQGFWWDYWNNNYRFGWANYLTELAPHLKSLGIDAIWIPPSAKNNSAGSVGYAPFDMYDLGDKYQKQQGDTTRSGTKDELLRMIAVLHANGIEVIEDMVINHNSDAAGTGGLDPESRDSVATASGYKNFRYVSYKTPLIDDSQNDYWTRAGRFAKNYENFHPNAANNCTATDICGTFWGPDIDYETPGAFGQSSNIPTSGSATIGGITRPYFNPVQSTNYMTNGGRDYMAWFKKQTAVDGFRFDAVKHYSIAAQNKFITYVKDSLPSWAKGGDAMMSVGEWVGNESDVDNYCINVASGGKKHTGTYDFSFRGYSTHGSGIYGMVSSGGSYDMQNLPSCQQNVRYEDYNHVRVYRTVPFVNSHDTYRPKLTTSGNFLSYLGDNSGWDVGNELGGNGQHIDPRDPRMPAAYAAVFSVDGNPAVFFEDVFDIGTTGKRWTHDPKVSTDLPVKGDIQNIIQAHQKLGFKDGTYAVPTAATGTASPAYITGSSVDHLVIERVGKAIIGISDAYNAVADNSADQTVWVTVGTSAWYNTDLVDYSGAHGVTTTHVYGDGRVLIKTAPCGNTIPGAHGHGYSIWAPVPAGTTFTSVNDMYTYLATYTPVHAAATTQEWEMADDLGDSHCKSLGQGGKIPDNATNERVVGRIYAAGGTQVSLTLTPEINGNDLTLTAYGTNGLVLATTNGVANTTAPISLNYTPSADGWVVIKVRNTSETNTGQKCWVDATYTAPAVVNVTSPASVLPTNVSIWTGNKGTSDMTDCGNWEGGLVPGTSSHVIVYGHAKPFPVCAANTTVNKVTLFSGAQLTVNPGINLVVLSQ